MAPAELHVEVVYSAAAGQMQKVNLQLPSESSVLDALRQAFPGVVLDGLVVGVWGKLRALDDTLRDRDRVEIYRPLLVDPKEARRQRYQSHRAKTKP
jgi:putative ubiquitin-RnfH superfamily antitoxin RatB of RatAB toxin-antitoxin module